MKYVVLGLLAACQTPAAETPRASSDSACAPALPLLAKQHTPNASRMYLASLSIDHDAVHVGPPSLATAKRGFVSQPSFTADGHGLYFTWRPEGSQADIWFRDLRTGAERAVTCTSVEEYAARPIGDGFVVVRVEADLSRHLVRLDRNGHDQQVLFPELANVGAHVWIDDTTALVFDPGPDGEPSSLKLADVRTGKIATLASDTGPSMAVIPGTSAQAISYVDLHDEHQPRLMRLELSTRATAPVMALPEGVTGVTWLSDGSVVRGDGMRILRATPALPGWHAVADLAGAIEGPILGLVVHGDRLVIIVHVE